MNDAKVYPVAVIGGGAAGAMAVLRSVLNNDECLFFPGTGKDKKKSRAFWVKKVENIPSFFEYTRSIEETSAGVYSFLKETPFWKKFIWMKNRGVQTLEKLANGLFKITDSKGDHYLAEYVILCTGIMDVQPKIDGEMKPIFSFANNQTADYCLRCDGHHAIGKNIAIVGHANGAAWVACMLHERYNPPSTSIFTHGEEDEFSDEVKQLIELYKINIYKRPIVNFLGEKGVLEGILLDDDRSIAAEFAMISLGMLVYNQLATAVDATIDDRGFVVTNAKGESSVDKLYIAGDLRANVKKQIYTAWDTAVDAADDINGRVRAKKRKILLCTETGY